MMTKEEFIKHSCEQMLRFTQAKSWDDLSEELKVQLGFNMGVMAYGLSLTKEDSFLVLANVRQGNVSMQAFRVHLKTLIDSNKIEVDEAQIARPF